MGFELIEDLSQEDKGFVADSVEVCKQLGGRAVLLLVGSRGAGFEPAWDLDLWVIGDKRSLSPERQKQYQAHEQLFVDRGDMEAHWTFYDESDLIERLGKWPSEMMWILSTSKFLYGRRETQGELQTRFSTFPRSVAEIKLRWLVGFYRMLLSPMYKVATRGCVTGAFAIAGQAIDALCKLCCVAERGPWPYGKWLTKVARDTHIGAKLVPFADAAVEAFLRDPQPTPGQPGSDWSPRRELRKALTELPQALGDLGWKGDWVSDPWCAVDETFKRAAP